MIELRHNQTQGRLQLQFSGVGELASLAVVRKALQAVQPRAGEVIVVDTSQVQRLDITAAWLIYQQTQHWQQQGHEVQLVQFPDEYRTYFAQPLSALLPLNCFNRTNYHAICTPVWLSHSVKVGNFKPC